MYNNSFVRKLRSSPTVVTDIDDNSTCSCNTNTKLIFGDKCSSWLLALFLVANSNSSNYSSLSLSQSLTDILWHHFHFVHCMVGFNSVHYLKFFQYGCRNTVENGLIFWIKTIKKTLLFATREFLILFPIHFSWFIIFSELDIFLLSHSKLCQYYSYSKYPGASGMETVYNNFYFSFPRFVPLSSHLMF